MLYSCLVDADYLDTEAFMNGAPVPRGGYEPPQRLLQKLEAYVSPWWEAKTDLTGGGALFCAPAWPLGGTRKRACSP